MPKRSRSPSGSPVKPNKQPRTATVTGLRTQFSKNFVKQVIDELQQLQSHESIDENAIRTHGERTKKVTLEVLLKATLPDVDPDSENVEALFLGSDEAKAYIASDDYDPDIPIIVDGNQHPELPQADPANGIKRPIEAFFDWIDDLDRTNSIQIPSRKETETSYQRKKLNTVKQKFLTNANIDPWNVLDLHNPLPASTPDFLKGINTQLLHRIRDNVLNGKSGERMEAEPDEWKSWRDVVDWALLAEGGCLTAPHTDANALETWITVQEGNFGYGWKPRPSEQDRETWVNNPLESTEGEWRYLVLKPGQTIYFGAGLIHYVFRVQGTQTLALGGHILRWNGINQWMDTLMTQLENPNMINEDMEETARKYVNSVEKLVKARIKYSTVDVVGGKEAFEQFQEQVKVCLVPTSFNSYF